MIILRNVVKSLFRHFESADRFVLRSAVMNDERDWRAELERERKRKRARRKGEAES